MSRSGSFSGVIGLGGGWHSGTQKGWGLPWEKAFVAPFWSDQIHYRHGSIFYRETTSRLYLDRFAFELVVWLTFMLQNFVVEPLFLSERTASWTIRASSTGAVSGSVLGASSSSHSSTSRRTSGARRRSGSFVSSVVLCRRVSLVC